MAPRLSSFLAELKRRKVYHVGAAYAAVAVGVSLAVAELFGTFSAPEWAAKAIIVVIALGFPIALVLAWAYEVRPEEPRKAEEATEGAPEFSFALDRKSIVVLPFDNMSPDPGDAYFTDGLTEEIITSLSHIHALRVISRNSAMVLKGTQKSTRAIAGELDVKYVLEGSVRRAGDDLRITAQLIDAASDEHLWAEKYDGVLDDVFGMQEQVSRSIVDAMELQLLPDEERRLTERSIENLQAYECYLRAKNEIWHLSEKSQDSALDLIRRGLKIAGESDLLYAAEGLIYFMHVDQVNRPPETFADLLNEAWTCAEKALAVNPSSAPAHSLKGLISQQRGNTREALRHFWGAHQIDPNNPEALCLLGYWRAAAGVDLDRARGFLEKLSITDPLTPMNKGALGWLHIYNGDFDAALEAWRDWQRECETLKNPYRIWLAYLHAANGNLDEAVRLVDLAIADSPQHILTALGTLLKHAWLGEKEQALEAVPEPFEEALKWDDGWTLLMAVGYAVIEETDRALHWLDLTIENGITNVAFYQAHLPFFEGLRMDDRFQGLMEKAATLSNLVLESLPTEEA
jgi:TolB-like protein